LPYTTLFRSNNQIRIERIYDILMQNARQEELKFVLKEIEDICKQKNLK